MDHHGCDEGGDGKFHFHIWLLVTLVKENQEVFPKWVMSLEILCHFTISYTGQTLALVSCHSNCVILLSTTSVILGPVPCCYCVIWLSTTLVTLGSVLCCNYCVILLQATLVTLGSVPCCNYCVIWLSTTLVRLCGQYHVTAPEACKFVQGIALYKSYYYYNQFDYQLHWSDSWVNTSHNNCNFTLNYIDHFWIIITVILL